VTTGSSSRTSAPKVVVQPTKFVESKQARCGL